MDELDSKQLVNGFQINQKFITTVDVQSTGAYGGKILIEIKSPKVRSGQLIMTGVVNVDLVDGKYTVDSFIDMASGTHLPNALIQYLCDMSKGLAKLVEDTTMAMWLAFDSNGKGLTLDGFLSAWNYEPAQRLDELSAIILGMIPDTQEVNLEEMLKVWDFEARLGDAVGSTQPWSPVNQMMTNIGRAKGILKPDEIAQDYYERFVKLAG